jgi:hypothetical protein
MSNLELDIKNLIIDALGLEDMTAEDIAAPCSVKASAWTRLTPWSWAWRFRNVLASRLTLRPKTPASTSPTWPVWRHLFHRNNPPKERADANP